MTASIMLSDAEAARLHGMAAAAVANVSRGLTDMFGMDVVVKALHVHAVPLARIAGLVGSPEVEIIGIYLEAEGDIPGHLLLLLQVTAAFELCDILLEQPAGATVSLGEMEVSALAEVGNIAGSFFLNTLADDGGFCLKVSPPSVVCDMAGALIDLALVDVAMYADEAIVINASFEHQGRRMPAWFLAFPDPERLRAVLGAGGRP